MLGDLPGLRHPQAYATSAEAGEGDEGARGWMSRESLALVAGWISLSLLMRWAWPLPEGVWYLFSLFGLARCVQLGNHLELRRLARQAR